VHHALSIRSTCEGARRIIATEAAAAAAAAASAGQVRALQAYLETFRRHSHEAS